MALTGERVPARLKTPQVKELADLEELLDSGLVERWGTAIDGGAHIGGWTRALAERFDKVHAFEPATDTFGLLAGNVADLANVVVHPCALLDEVSPVQVVNPRGEGRGPLTARYVAKVATGGLAPIWSTTVDAFGLTDLDLLKLDLEGAEVLALHGAWRTLERCQPLVIIEEFGHGYRYGFAAGDAEALLVSWGFAKVWEAGPNLAFKRAAA